MRPRPFWQDMTTADFAELDLARTIAVLPIAAVEQHGPHLPLSTDSTIAEVCVARAVAIMPDDLHVTFLPVQQIGKSNEHISSPGTLTLSWQTVTQAWIEIGECVHRAGIRKFLLVTSHGGNVSIMDIVARELRVRHEMLAVSTGWARFGQPADLYPPEEAGYGIHGGDVETSIMLAARPELVRMDRAKDFRSIQTRLAEQHSHLRAHGPAQFGWKAQDLNGEGAMGNAANATADKGRRSIEHAASGLIALCRDMDRFDINDLWSTEAG